jgi:hypothetical protein
VKKVWTKAARAAFARKMKAARLAKRGRARVRKRSRNPTKAQVKAAASRIAKAAGRLAWRGAKLGGRMGKAGAKAAAAEVKASICRPRAANPRMRFAVKAGNAKRFVTQMRFANAKDAMKFARLYAKANRSQRVGVYRV